MILNTEKQDWRKSAHSGLAQIQSPSLGATFGMLFGRMGRSAANGGALSRGRGASLYLRGAAENDSLVLPTIVIPTHTKLWPFGIVLLFSFAAPFVS